MAIALTADPTFTAKVGIHVPGTGDVDVEFIFKHRDKDELDKFVKASKGVPDVDYIMSIATGWELTEEFNKKNVTIFLRSRISAADRITRKYFAELYGAKEKN